MKPLFLLLTFGAIFCDAQKDKVPILGNWAVGDCILAQFNLNITIHIDPKDDNKTLTVKIPKDAQVDKKKSKCGEKKNDDQLLVLHWEDKVVSESIEEDLDREITIIFRKNVTSNYYGIERFYGEFLVKQWTVNETLYNQTVTVDSKEVPAILFHTPLDRSFMCRTWGSAALVASLKVTPGTGIPKDLANATVSTSMLKFDAFRTTGHKIPTGFRTPLDCEYQPNDIVPIAVGVALAVMVIVVLVAYVIGRKRNRQRGYESV